MAKIKYRSGNSLVDLYDSATIANMQNQINNVSAKVNTIDRYWDGMWLVERRDDWYCTAVGSLWRSVSAAGLYTSGLYYYNFDPPAFPSGLFKGAPKVMTSIESANATCMLATYSNSNPSASSPQTVRILSATNGTINLTVRYEAIGPWRA